MHKVSDICTFADLPIDKLADLMYHVSMLYGADNEIWTHPERWRDWPYEAAATIVHVSGRNGANSCRLCLKDERNVNSLIVESFFII